MVDRRFPTDHSFLEGVIARRLPARGYRLLWVMQSAAPRPQAEMACWEGSPVVVLPRGGRRGFVGLVRDRLGLLASTLRLVPRLRRWRPTLVYVRNEPIHLLIGLFVARLVGCPVVFQISHLKEEEMLERAEIAVGNARMAFRVQGWVARVLRDLLARRVDHVLPISPAMSETLARQWGRRSPPMTVFPLGIDPSADRAPGFYRLPGASPYMLYMGTAAPVRRLDVVVQAFGRVAPVHPAWRLLMLGGSLEAEGRERLVALVHRLGLSDRVLFVADVPRREVGRFVRGAAFGLSVIPPTGVLRTLSPTKLMEYMLDGLPVLASLGIQDQEEIVRESRCGRLVEFEEAAIAAGMESLILEPDRQAMGLRGQQYILSERSYADAAVRLDRLCRQLLQQ